MLVKIDENGFYQNLYPYDEIPLIEEEGELIPDKTFVSELVPNDIFVSEENPPKWTGSEWIATAERPETTLNLPSDIEKLEAKITAAGAYTDFLEELVFELAMQVYE